MLHYIALGIIVPVKQYDIGKLARRRDDINNKITTVR